MPDQDEDLKTLYSEMPLRYRLLAKLLKKIPIPRMPFLITRKLPLVEGVFHGMMLPIFVFLVGILMFWLIPTATLVFGFPLNIAVLSIVLGLFVALFARIELERSIHWWRAVFGSPAQWDTSKTIEELVELFKKQQRKKARQ